MSMFEDDRPRKPVAALPGESLSALSLHELRERIALYRGEIERLDAEIAAKEKTRAAADFVSRNPQQ